MKFRQRAFRNGLCIHMGIVTRDTEEALVEHNMNGTQVKDAEALVAEWNRRGAQEDSKRISWEYKLLEK